MKKLFSVRTINEIRQWQSPTVIVRVQQPSRFWIVFRILHLQSLEYDRRPSRLYAMGDCQNLGQFCYSGGLIEAHGPFGA